MHGAAPRSCASCGISSCAMNKRHGVLDPPTARVSYVLDEVWPEYASMVASSARADDQVIAPAFFDRYAWPGSVDRCAKRATLARHLAMRRVARANGGVRQRAYLRNDRALAHALARRIDYRAGHLVVAQSWLPWLDEAGVLGGRSFDVVMSRYPMADIHMMLDRIARETGGSATITDFRADPALVERESMLLERARAVITPHHGIAALFGGRAAQLAWHRPVSIAQRPGTRTAFLGPTITRQRPDIALKLAQMLDDPLIVFGTMLDDSDVWSGLPIEHRAFGPDWLDDIGTILHPAPFTAQPRRLLQAIANGIRVVTTTGSGLDPADYTPMQIPT
jgi:hypothetical protein